jgi:hypothetical protein
MFLQISSQTALRDKDFPAFAPYAGSGGVPGAFLRTG